MTQILVYLVANPFQDAGATGDVGVEWAETGDPAQAELTVWDTGSGFEGDGSKLFAPWYTTRPGGSGLGLAITHRLVRAHGWNINAARKDGRTRFVIGIRVTELAGARGGESRAQEVA
jgi:signal transduction histidine kinase